MIKQPKSTLADLPESYFRRRLVAQRHAGPATVSSYRDALQLLITFAPERTSKLSSEDLDRDTVLAFLDHLEQELHNVHCLTTSRSDPGEHFLMRRSMKPVISRVSAAFGLEMLS
jgi:site-specific recombinase XerD